ncbi:hypothetical protein [Lactiplantibacillus pentosus]|nr:hypothetical protein [Lactiplantibacillus pentosus]
MRLLEPVSAFILKHGDLIGTAVERLAANAGDLVMISSLDWSRQVG